LPLHPATNVANEMTIHGVKPLLQRIAAGDSFSASESRSVLEIMTDRNATPAQMGAYLMALRVRGETIDEITGAALMMRERMTRVMAPSGAVDIVGTGGDGHCTYNVSTCASLVAAGAGSKIAKHGNRSVSSLSGASDVLGALGVKVDVGPLVIERDPRGFSRVHVGPDAPLGHEELGGSQGRAGRPYRLQPA
jgi:anthranilate phosphoribosyltransferase